MRSHLKKILRNVLLIIVVSSALDARTFDLHISIPISQAENPEVYKTLLAIQKQIVKAAGDKGYCFNTDMLPNVMGFHITLETVHRVDERDLKKCAQCIEAIRKTMHPFDLTSAFIKTQFKLMGSYNPWGTLRIANNDHLEKLAQHLKTCLQKSGLSTGKFEKFNPHISLGRFFKLENTSLVKKEDLHWVPDFNIRLSKKSFMVKNLHVSKKEFLEDENKENIKPKYLITPAQSYELSPRSKKVKSDNKLQE